MKKGAILTVTIVISALMLSFIAFPLSATAQAPDFIPGKTQVVSAFGKVPGQDLIVHVLVLVPQGSDKNEIANEAVRQQGARPIDHTEFSLTGLVWDKVLGTNNVLVKQYYNDFNEPNNLSITGDTALQDTHIEWSNATPEFAFDNLESTDRCPSLVRECPGRQTSDGNNDVAWLSLKGKNTLGVTWFNTNTVEADMAMNTKFSWSTDNTGGIDLVTVFLHENGHVVGLGHSDVTGAVMEAVYAGIRQSLHPDDVAGITTLYPVSEIPNDTVAPTVVSGETSFSTSIELIMSENVVNNNASPSDFTVSGAASSPTVTSLSFSGNTVTLTLNVSLTDTDTITVSYTQTSGSIDDEFGNSLIDFADQPVTNNLGTQSSTVSVSSITYDTEGGKNGDKQLLITLSVVDDSNNSVSGASVSIDLYRDGSKIASGTSTTGSSGTITFSLKNAAAGSYSTTVTDVTASGLTWDGTTPDNGFNKLNSSKPQK